VHVRDQGVEAMEGTDLVSMGFYLACEWVSRGEASCQGEPCDEG
jgi:hypothetical protein